jgi:hypothetical protein
MSLTNFLAEWLEILFRARESQIKISARDWLALLQILLKSQALKEITGQKPRLAKSESFYILSNLLFLNHPAIRRYQSDLLTASLNKLQIDE